MTQPYQFHEKDLKKVARGAWTTLLGASIGKGLFFLSHLLVARHLGPEAFGLYALGFAAIRVLEIFSRLGLSAGA